MSRVISAKLDVDVNGKRENFEVEVLHVPTITGDHYLKYWTALNRESPVENRLKDPSEFMRGRMIAFLESTIESASYTDAEGNKTAITLEAPIAAPLQIIRWIIEEADKPLADAFRLPNESRGKPSKRG